MKKFPRFPKKKFIATRILKLNWLCSLVITACLLSSCNNKPSDNPENKEVNSKETNPKEVLEIPNKQESQIGDKAQLEDEENLKFNMDDTSSLRLKHSGDNWKKTYSLIKEDDLWVLPIKDLGLTPGVYEYNLIKDNIWEPNGKRILNIIENDKKELLPPELPIVVEPLAESSKLIVQDPNTGYLAIKHEQDGWSKEYPLEPRSNLVLEAGVSYSPIRNKENKIYFRKPNNVSRVNIKTSQDGWSGIYQMSPSIQNGRGDIYEIDVEKLNWTKGTHKFKFQLDGEFELGPDRLVKIDGTGQISDEQPNQSRRPEFWEIDIKKLNLKPGKVVYELVTNNPLEKETKRVLHISPEGLVYFPNPKNPKITGIGEEKKALEIEAPNSYAIGLKHSGDNWERIIQLEKENDLFKISAEELNLSPGSYDFEIVNLDEPYKLQVIEREKGGLEYFLLEKDSNTAGRRFTISITENEEVIVEPKNENNTYPPKGSVFKIKAPVTTNLALKELRNWSKTYPFKKTQNGEWIMDISDLDLPKNKRTLFKFVLDGKVEDTPARPGFIDDKNQLVFEKQKSNLPVTISRGDLPNKNSYFGDLLEISPDEQLSMKSDKDWFNAAIIYHIWVPSFKDSKSGSLANDNMGDLKGIKDVIRSGYFNALGVNALWLSPIFGAGDEDYPDSKMHGYETKNLFEINKNFGSLEDFRDLLKEAHKNNIRIILEFVPNHVGRNHPWFKAGSDPTNENYEKFKDWFVWRDQPIETLSPWWNNSDVWHFLDGKGQFYYGLFTRNMPDLNYRNPEVVQEMANVAIYWLNMGVDGFRVDANGHLFENPSDLTSGTENQPETIEFFQELHKVVDEYAAKGYEKVLIAENCTTDTGKIELWGETPKGRAFDLSLNFAFPDAIKKVVEEEGPNGITEHIDNEQPKNIGYLRFLTNHDRSAPRAKTNFGEARLLASAINMLLPGPFIIYYGEEIDMEGAELEGVRNRFEWDKIESLNNEKGNTGPQILEIYKKLGSLRNKYSDFFTKGKSEVFGSEDWNKIFIKYSLEGKELLWVIGTRPFEQEVSIKVPTSSKVKNIMDSSELGQNKNGEISLSLSPYGVGGILIEK